MITVRREGDKIAIIVPEQHLQSLRVAIQPCLCGHTKSIRTADLRAFFVKIFGLGIWMKPGEVKHINTEDLEG